MSIRRLMSSPRLARNVLVSLLDRHARVAGAPRVLTAGGVEVARLDEIVWLRRHVRLRGRARAGTIDISFDGRVAAATGADGFDLLLERPEKGAALTVLPGSGASIRFPPPPRLREGLARAVALPSALAEIATELLPILRFLQSGDPAVAARLRRRFGLCEDARPAVVIPEDLFANTEPRAATGDLPAIVVPVFNAFDDLCRLLEALAGNAGAAHRLILVDDGSTDPRVAPLLEDTRSADPACVRVLRMPRNQGFVAAVNTGLRLAADETPGHVVILNTDTLPPPGWLPRLLAPIAADPTVASVTPMSETAEILSVPAPAASPPLSAAQVARIDATAQRIAPTRACVDLPTGIGFCMALNRSFLDRIGGFDAAFGRGYGEEVDWCRKAAQAGGRNVAATNLFVGHRGSASFGEDKARRIAAAGRIVSARYPDYDAAVRDWSRADPAEAQRMALSLAWLAAVSDGPVPVFVGHSLGGGAETALAAELADGLAAGAPGLVVIRVGGRRALGLELVARAFTLRAEVSDPARLDDLLAPLDRRRVVYSCGVGGPDPALVPRLLQRLATADSDLQIRLHDFFPVSPSWNLLGRDGRFGGVPALDSSDPVHGLSRRAGHAPLPHHGWRALWAPVFSRASEVTVFAPSGRDLIAEAYPEARARCVVRPHATPNLPGLVPPGGTALGVLGDINLPKGAGVLEALGRAMHDRRIVLLGRMDGAYRLAPPHVMHGRYDQARIADLARAYGIGAWLIPSICPETFSFATHEALATGLPVLCFDRGAQADAVRAAPNGRRVTSDPEDTAALVAAIQAAFCGSQAPVTSRAAP